MQVDAGASAPADRRAMAAVEELEREGAPPGLHVAMTAFDDVRVRPENDLRADHAPGADGLRGAR